MGWNIAILVLISALIHPLWNTLLKKAPDSRLGFVAMTATLALCGLVHGVIAGVDFSAALTVIPLILLSILGQLIYGNCLTATLRRGDLSTYYPIIRASPVVIVIISFIFLGKSYPFLVLVGIAMVVTGGFFLLYRRGTRLLDDPATLGLALLALTGTGIYSLADAQLMQAISPQVLVMCVDGFVLPIYAFLWVRSLGAKTTVRAEFRAMPWFYLLAPGVMAYTSYYLILWAYQLGGDVASVTSLRQASIPISVALGGMVFSEGAMIQRFFAALLLALGIIVIVIFG